MEDYRKFENLGTNFAVTDTTGNLLTVLPGERPIFIPYPSDSSATLEKATAQIGIARKTYPELSRRLAVIEKAWAAVPQPKAATIATAPASPPPPAASKPLPGAAPKGMEIVTTSGTKYENVTVTSVDPDGLSISHETGVAKVLFTALSAELQTKYGYDPQKAAQFSTAVQNAAMQRRAAADAAEATKKQLEENPPVRIIGKVTQCGEAGLLVEFYFSTDFLVAGGMRQFNDPKRPALAGGVGVRYEFYLIGHPRQAQIVDGDSIDVDAVPAGTHSGGGGKVKQFKIIQAFKDPFK